MKRIGISRKAIAKKSLSFSVKASNCTSQSVEMRENFIIIQYIPLLHGKIRFNEDTKHGEKF